MVNTKQTERDNVNTTFTSNQKHSQFRTKEEESHTVKIAMINISSSRYSA